MNPSKWFYFWQKDEANTNQENRRTFTKVINLQPPSLVGHLPHDLQRWDFLVSPSRCPRHPHQDLRPAHQVIIHHPQQQKRDHPHSSSIASFSTTRTTKSSTAKQAEQTTGFYRVPTGADTVKATIFSLFKNLQQSSPCSTIESNFLIKCIFLTVLLTTLQNFAILSSCCDDPHFLFSRILLSLIINQKNKFRSLFIAYTQLLKKWQLC